MDDNNVEEIAEGFVPIVRAEGDITLRESGAMAVVAGGNVSMSESGSGMFIAGGDATLSEAGAGNMLIGGNVSIDNGAMGNLVAGGEVSVVQSRVGVLLTPSAKLENSEVILGTQQAVALGVVAGLMMFLLSRLFRRR